MIQEAYVSFETAKLLKEKGFDEECYTFYEYDSGDFYREERNPCCNSYSDDYTATTQQRAMKWLREKHNIVIVVVPSMFWGKYNVSIYKKDNDCPIGFDGDSLCPSYEQACEAAIKYCLQNLI